MITMDTSPRLPDPACSRAVLVGCSRYSHLKNLPAVAGNLTDLRVALTDTALGGFAPGSCRVLDTPQAPAQVAEFLLREARRAQDTLLMYFAGHGVLGRRNELHLAIAGTSPDQALAAATALPYPQVREILLESPARNKIVVLDCCFAGYAIHDMADPVGAVTGQTAVTGAYVLTSVAAHETSLAPTGARHTAFTGALLELLRAGLPQGP